jgi:hypothetical protein
MKKVIQLEVEKEYGTFKSCAHTSYRYVIFIYMNVRICSNLKSVFLSKLISKIQFLFKLTTGNLPSDKVVVIKMVNRPVGIAADLMHLSNSIKYMRK